MAVRPFSPSTAPRLRTQSERKFGLVSEAGGAEERGVVDVTYWCSAKVDRSRRWGFRQEQGLAIR